MKFQDVLKIGSVIFRAGYGNIREIEADAFVQPSGTSAPGGPMQASPWVIEANKDGQITAALSAHYPFQLGQVIVTSAGDLKAKYLLSAVVIDWERWGDSAAHQDLLVDEVIVSTARKCIEIALALDLESIVFTPWGTRIGAAEASRSTALLIQAMAGTLQTQAGKLKTVYLVSNQKEHYDWFIDRGYVFQVMFDQINQFRKQVSALDLSPHNQEELTTWLNNLQSNVLSNVNVFLDQSQRFNQSGGINVTADKVDVAGDVTGRDKMSST